MRVIGGAFRSRRLKSLPGLAIRPTPDRLRQTLFDVLAPRIQGVTFVDAYAGTGVVGIEALSRGAARAIFLERSHRALEVIRENLASLGLEDRAVLAPGAVRATLSGIHGDIVFLDPPYELEREYGLALALLAERPPPLAIAQHSRRLALETSYGTLRRARVIRQGDNALTFYEHLDPQAAP